MLSVAQSDRAAAGLVSGSQRQSVLPREIAPSPVSSQGAGLVRIGDPAETGNMVTLEANETSYEVHETRAEYLRNMGALIFRDSAADSEDETLVLNRGHQWTVRDVEILLDMGEPL